MIDKQLKNIIKILGLIMLVTGSFTASAENLVIAVPKPQSDSVSNSVQIIEKNLSGANGLASPKIVGGTTAGRNEFPEFAQLFADGAAIGLDPNFVYAICGATLLTTNKVLTAAHCTTGISVQSLYVLPKFYSFTDNITFNDLIPLFAKIEQPQYGLATRFDYDVSILTLSQNVNSPTAKLFAGEDQLAGFTATTIGVGLLSESGQAPNTLQKVDIPVVSNAICQQSYGSTAITDRMLCAGLVAGGKDSCQGDSGGPLWVDFNGEKTQAGIVSWGNGCARPNFYGVYSRTSTLINFILQHAPGTEVVKADNVNIVSMLHMLLLDDNAKGKSFPDECDAETISIGDVVSVSTSEVCYDNDFSPRVYFKKYTFELLQNERLTIKSNANHANANSIELYSGINGNIQHLETATWSTNDGGSTLLIRDIQAGQYSLYIRTFTPSSAISLSIIKNVCGPTQLDLDTPTSFIFRHNCQDIEIGNEYISYHSFSMVSRKDVYITASADSNKSIVLYKNNNGQLTRYSNRNFAVAGQDAVIHEYDLPVGHYVIKTSGVDENTLVTLDVNTVNCITKDTIQFGEQKTVSFNSNCQTIMGLYRNELVFNTSESTDTVIRSDGPFRVNSRVINDISELINGEHVVSSWYLAGSNTIAIVSDDANASQTIHLDKKSCVHQNISIGDSINIEFSDICRDILGNYLDYRAFTLTQNTNLTITAQSATGKNGITLYAGSDDQLNYIISDYSNNGAMMDISENLQPGTYTILSETDNTNSSFSLSLQ